VTEKGFATARRWVQKFGPGVVPKPVPPRAPLSPSKRLEVKRFLERNSSPSSSRTIFERRGATAVLPVRSLLKPLGVLHREFERDVGPMSYTSFRRAFPPNYKQPHGLSDVCPLCASGSPSPSHLSLNSIQRKAYEKDKNVICDEEICLTTDFKQNILLGQTRVQVPAQFYQQRPNSVFGVVLRYLDNGTPVTRSPLSFFSLLYPK
jgi:hypothetical protein